MSSDIFRALTLGQETGDLPIEVGAAAIDTSSRRYAEYECAGGQNRVVGEYAFIGTC
jgi:hypothetical protein